MSMLRAVVRGRVVSSLVHLSPPPPRPPQSRVGVLFPVAPSRPSGFDVRDRFGIGVLRYKTECSSAPGGTNSSIPSSVQVDDLVGQLESYAARLQNLEKMEQVIKSLDEIISREVKTLAVSAKEILENQQNPERFLRRMKTENNKEWVLLIIEGLKTICFLGLTAYFVLQVYSSVGHKENYETVESDNEMKQKSKNLQQDIRSTAKK